MTEEPWISRRHITVALRRTTLPVAVGASALVVAVVTFFASITLSHHMADIATLYLLGVVVVAMRFGYVASLVAAALSVAAFDFFFTEPYLSFAVAEGRHVLTFVIMLLVAFIISNLMERIRRSAERAHDRELHTAQLYGMSREIASARTSEDIAVVACRHVGRTLAADISVLLPGSSGLRRFTAVSGPKGTAEALESTFESETWKAMAADRTGALTEASAGVGERIFALRTVHEFLGLLVARHHEALPSSEADESQLLGAFLSQIALAIERTRLAADAQRAQVEVQNERLRNALLSSVSHDLRTPLAVVKGAATALLEGADLLSVERRREYARTITDEANHLNHLVRNLLSMTSLEAGALKARKEWQLIEEVVGIVLDRLNEQLSGRPVHVDIAPDAALAPFDATLIEQVLVNLIENSIRYAAIGTPMSIRAISVERAVEIQVTDRGPGVPAGQEEKIFDKFQRAAGDRSPGMGLGLTICRGILDVHGGRIWCVNTPEGGASFRFRLPRETEAPEMDGLPDLASDG